MKWFPATSERLSNHPNCPGVFFELQEPHSASCNDVFVGARHSISSEFESVILESFLFKGVAESEAMSQPYRHQLASFGIANYRIAVSTHVTSHVFLPMIEDHNDVIFRDITNLFICISSIVAVLISKSLFGPSQQKASWKVLFFPWLGWAAVVIRFNVARRNQKNITSKNVKKNTD